MLVLSFAPGDLSSKNRTGLRGNGCLQWRWEENDGEKKRGNLGRNGKAEEMKGVAEEMEERAPGLKELVPKRARGNPLTQISIIMVKGNNNQFNK